MRLVFFKNAGYLCNEKEKKKSVFFFHLFSLGYYINVKSHFLLLPMISKHTKHHSRIYNVQTIMFNMQQKKKPNVFRGKKKRRVYIVLKYFLKY